MNMELFQGLTSQIQRIFSELSTLKDHLGLKNGIFDGLNVHNNQTPSTIDKDQFFNSKWTGLNSNKLGNREKTSSSNEKSISNKNDVPIIALGMKNKSSFRNRNKSSIIDEFKDLTASKGISDDEALDNLSNRLFNKANNYLGENKSRLFETLQTNPKPHGEVESQSPEPSFSQRCEKCNMKIPKEAKFCSKCGNKSI